MPRVAILISHADQEPFKSIVQGFSRPSSFAVEEFSFDLFYFQGRQAGQLENWFRVKVESLRYSAFWPALRLYDSILLWLFSIYLPSANVATGAHNRIFLQTHSPEDQRHIAIKLYSALKYCEKKNYDYVLRTTSNSIFNITNLVIFLRSNMKSSILYAGREVKSFARPSFISGSFLILNKNAIKLLLASRATHNYGVLDDVAIGKIFSKSKSEITKRYCESIDFPNVGSLRDYSSERLLGGLHYRCKATKNPRNDLEIMLELAKLLRERRISYV